MMPLMMTLVVPRRRVQIDMTWTDKSIEREQTKTNFLFNSYTQAHSYIKHPLNMLMHTYINLV